MLHKLRQCDAVEEFVDHGAKARPHGAAGAVALAGCIAAHRAQVALGQPQDIAHGIALHGTVEPVAAVFAVGGVHEVRLAQDGHDGFQIFLRDALFLSDFLQGHIAVSIIYV